MTHARETVRDAFVTALTGLATTGANVFASRTWPLDDTTIPGLLIHAEYETVEGQLGRMAELQHRNLTIMVRGRDKLAEGMDDQLDDIAAEVETAIFAADMDGVYGIDLERTDILISAGMEKPVGEIAMTFRVHYITETGTPGTAV